jgi:hypothetical protein
MIECRDLAALVVPRAGSLEATGNPWEPWRLCDPSGEVVAPVAAYLQDLQASGRPETTRGFYDFHRDACTAPMVARSRWPGVGAAGASQSG